MPRRIVTLNLLRVAEKLRPIIVASLIGEMSIVATSHGQTEASHLHEGVAHPSLSAETGLSFENVGRYGTFDQRAMEMTVAGNPVRSLQLLRAASVPRDPGMTTRHPASIALGAWKHEPVDRSHLSGIAETYWTKTSGPITVNVNALAVAPDGMILAGVSPNPGTGLYASSNRGMTWGEVTTLTAGPVQAVCVDSSGDLIVSDGSIWRSLDRGDTWEIVYSGSVSKNGPIALVNGQGNRIFCAGDQGIFRSMPGGLRWERLRTPNASSATRTLANTILVGAKDTVYRSTDVGATWSTQSVHAGVAQRTPFVQTCLYTAPDGSIYFSVYGTSLTPLGVATDLFRSSDDGVTWSLVRHFSDASVTCMTSAMGSVLFGGGDVWGARKLFASSDGGGTFNDRTDSTTSSLSCIVHLASDSVLAGGFDGVAVSSDGGSHWTRRNAGFKDSNLDDLACGTDNAIYVANGRGLHRMAGLGQGWDQLYNTVTMDRVKGLPSGTLLAGSYSGVMRSTDKGSSWHATSLVWPKAGMPFPHRFLVTDSNAILVSLKSVFLAPVRPPGVFRSTDDGQTWEETSITEGTIEYFAKDRSGQLYAARGDSGIYVSSDDGRTWTLRLSSDIGSAGVSSLACAPDGTLIVGSYSEPAVLLSHDAGKTFTTLPLNTYLMNLFTASNGHVLAGERTVGGGCVKSTDNGSSWVRVATGAEGAHLGPFVELRGGPIVAGSWGEGVYIGTSALLTSSRTDHTTPGSFRLEQNYPNPFNPSTTIRYELGAPANVRVSVYDILGREVTVLVNERGNAGIHEVEFDASGLASGVYYYRIQSGDFVRSRALLLLR